MKNSLGIKYLRKTCEIENIKTGSNPGSPFSNMIVGQQRATKALRLGVSINATGFNIYAAGDSGTGKIVAVKNFADEAAGKAPPPSDWCYVNNFKDPYQPTKLSLPAGRAAELKKDMKDLIRDALQTLVKAFESEEYANRRKKIVEAFEVQHAAIIGSITERAKQESLLIKQTPWEIITIPLINGEPVTDEQFNGLPDWKQEDIRTKQNKFLDEIKEKLNEIRKREKEVAKELGKLEKEVAIITISSLIEEITDSYKELPDVLTYFQQVKNDILENLSQFLVSQKDNLETGGQQSNDFSKRYEVNVLVNNADLKGAPVIIERNPTYHNLLGRVEKESYMGTLLTDFTMIRKGALHCANGGYLIIRAEELLSNHFSWNGLKRALKNNEIHMEEVGDQLGLFTTRTLKPEPIPLDVKVILVGEPVYYHLLYLYEPDFKTLFKVKADFDSEMNRDEKSISDYILFTRETCNKENLLLPDDAALAKMIEYGSRLVSDQLKLSTHFDEIADIIREANHYAKEEKVLNITANHITKTIEEKVYRSNLVQEKINEMITSQQILIDITGQKTGQVNGLSVLDLGDISFGRPIRITCSIGLGKEGIIAVEREAELSGPIHTKGVMILSGYLTEKYIQQKPVSLAARLVFEQSYSEVEGDSASSTELYAILSNLSGLPVKQGIAVTGSVNQKGQVQAIGAVNEKIEGYYEVCKILGFTGEQGVIIPASNLQNLMLKEEVLTAVENNQFTIWAVDTIDDGIEILTGVRSGSPEEEGTVAYLVNKALNEYANRMKEYSSEEDDEKGT